MKTFCVGKCSCGGNIIVFRTGPSVSASSDGEMGRITRGQKSPQVLFFNCAKCDSDSSPLSENRLAPDNWYKVELPGDWKPSESMLIQEVESIPPTKTYPYKRWDVRGKNWLIELDEYGWGGSH